MYVKQILCEKKYVLTNLFSKSTVKEYTCIFQKYFTHECKAALLF